MKSILVKLIKKIYHRIYIIPSLFIIKKIYSKKSIVRNKIVVDNFGGRGFGDNPKYIVEALLKKDPSLDIVWEVSNMQTPMPKDVRKVKYGSPRNLKELLTARVWIDNIKNSFKPEKRKGQFYLQTWHGGIAFKKIEKAAAITLDQGYINASKADSAQIDLMISDSDWVTKNYQDNFWYSGKIVKTGFPRNDVFFNDVTKTSSKVKQFYKIPGDTGIILYAPTFREKISIEKQKQLYQFDEQRVIRTFEKKFSKKFVIIKRMHPNIADQIKIKENSMVKNGSSYPDMQSLLVASSILITDFSSSAFDFMLKGDKIFLFTPDYNEYVQNERGLNFNIKKDLPFPVAENTNELIANINNFDEKMMNKKVNNLKKSFKLKEDGHASERVAKILLNVINEK